MSELLFEIGVEEVPPSYVPPALEQLERGAGAGLAELRLEFGDVRALGAPRRLALLVSGIAARQPDRDEEVTGPSAKAAWDAEGKPTRALLGFCQGKGVDPAAVRRVATAKGEYVAVTVHRPGRDAADVLPPFLADLAARLVFPKSMRWLDDDTRFARPVRWLVALLGDRMLPVRAFGLEAGRTTRGHRFLAPGPIELARAGDYVEALRRGFVLVDPAERSKRLEQQLERLAAEVSGRVRHDPELLEIDTFLAEWPTAFLGRFEQRFLDLPDEVIITALREHQRFFAVHEARPADPTTRDLVRQLWPADSTRERIRPADPVGTPNLLECFLAVRDGDDRGLDVIRRGNEAVLTARLEDAEFYWRTDLSRTPEQRVESLAGIVWMEGLGSLHDKATRLQSLGAWLAERLAPEAAEPVRRAAVLCKTDLASEMIGSGKEYAALQGVIGSYYAEAAGEPEAVCRAIFEHYRPAGSGDELPQSPAGAMLALADKLDHVAGVFVKGKAPTGSEDPYGVRRAGNGIVRILIEQDRHLDLYAASMEATKPFFAADPDLPHAGIMKQLGEFWRGRVETALDERGVAYDARDAALEARTGGDGRGRPGWNDPADALARARALAAFRTDPRFEPLAILFKRVANILKAATETLPPLIDRAALGEPAERALLEALERARTETSPLWERRAYDKILPALLAMEQAIHTFFDEVLVNAEDLSVRVNRLRLLAEIRGLFLRGWDLSRVVIAGERIAGGAPASTPAGSL